MKRKLLVSTREKAIEMMKAYLASQLIESEIEKDLTTGDKEGVLLARISRDLETDIWIGCPCFVCDFKGVLPNGEKVHGIVYVKVFPTQTTRVTQMYIVKDYLDYNFDFVLEGDIIEMKDALGRYEDEVFVYENGQITPV